MRVQEAYGAGTKSTEGALVDMANPDRRMTVDSPSGDRRVAVARVSKCCREAAIFCAVRRIWGQALAYV